MPLMSMLFYFRYLLFPLSLQKECDCGRKNTSEEDIEDDGDDTEEDIAIVHPDVGNEVRKGPNSLHDNHEMALYCLIE